MSRPLSTIVPALGVAAALGLPLSAQDRLPGAVEAVAPIASAHGLAVRGNGLHGFGHQFASTFDRTGFTFVPALAAAPHSQRLAVSLTSIRRGANPLPIALDAHPEQVGTTVVYRRSPTIEERYEVRVDGVEQSFVFDALPGSGDLVVRCALRGELGDTTAVGSTDEVRLTLPGLGGVSIGGVTGIDAAGRRCAGELHVTAGVLELRLPASFVDHATLPLVLDPLFGARIDVATGTVPSSDPAVAYGAQSGDYLIVWTRTLSMTSSEIYARHYNETTGLGTAFLVGSGATLRRPTVAYHRFQGRFLIVWERTASWLGAAQLTSSIVNHDRTLGPALDLTLATANCTHASLSGNPGTAQADTGGLLVYREAGVGIRALPYTMALSVTGLTLGTVTSVGGDPLNELPRISRSGSGTRVVSFARPGWITAQPVDQAGTAVGVGYSFQVGSNDVLRSDIDGAGSNFMIVHESIGASSREITARLFAWNAPNLSQVSTGAVTSNSVDDREPVVALLGPKYLVAWTQTVGFLDTVVKARPFATTGCISCGVEVTVTGTQISERTPAIGGRLAGGDPTPQALIASASFRQSFEFTGDITATRFTAEPGAEQSTQLWSGCGAPVGLSTVGAFALGNSTFQFRLSASPAGTLAYFGLGFGGAQLPCGTCVLVQPVVLQGVPLVGGQATYGLRVPCDSRLLGAALDVQGLVLGAVTNQCPLLTTLSTSPARRYVIVE